MIEPYYVDKDNPGIVIYKGDCVEILETLDAVDHTITDPPYARDIYVRLGMPNTKKGSGTPARLGISNHQYSSLSLAKLAAGDIGAIDEMLVPVARNIAELTRRWAVVFSDVESVHLWREQLERRDMRYVRTGAWVKNDPTPQFSGDRPSVGFEPCTIVHAKGPMRWNGGGLPAVWTFNTAKGDARPDHPCPKPLPLMERLIMDFTDPGDTVLDPFGSSMTTAVACKRLGRNCISIEIDEGWCKAGALRLKNTLYRPPLPGLVVERGEQGAMAL